MSYRIPKVINTKIISPLIIKLLDEMICTIQYDINELEISTSIIIEIHLKILWVRSK